MSRAAKKVKQQAAASARAAHWVKTTPEYIVISDSDSDLDIECTGWTGGICHVISDSEDSDAGYSTVEYGGEDDDYSFEELVGDELISGLQKEWQMRHDLEQLAKPTVTEILLHQIGPKEWKKAESHRSLGYNGKSDRRKREKKQQKREKAAADAIIQNRYVFTAG